MQQPTTFSELQNRLSDAKFRKAILLKLIEHIDENFLPNGGGEPKMLLLTDDKIPVPVAMFEAVVEDTLNAEVKQVDQVMNNIMTAPIAAPAPQAATPEPKKKTKKREAA
jgi:hypothetical protein